MVGRVRRAGGRRSAATDARPAAPCAEPPDEIARARAPAPQQFGDDGVDVRVVEGEEGEREGCEQRTVEDKCRQEELHGVLRAERGGVVRLRRVRHRAGGEDNETDREHGARVESHSASSLFA